MVDKTEYLADETESLLNKGNYNSLDPFFITGITDAEGSFVCVIRSDTASRFTLSSVVYIRPTIYSGICVRNYSSSSSPVVPWKIYIKMDLYKLNVINDNRGKSGIYLMTNLINNKTYIGSSVNLGRRFTCYYSFNHIKRWKTSNICKALIKYGYSNFQLTILEYCTPEKCIEREQYYFDKLKPEYNILKKAGSLLGFKHSEKTLIKFRKRKHSEETRAKISAVQIGKVLSEETKAKLKGLPRPKGSGRSKIQIEVFDVETGIKTIYVSISEASLALGAHKGTISKYITSSSNKPFKGRYVITKNNIPGPK